MRTVTLTFDMDERTAKLFRQSAIERVINTSMRIVERSKHEDAYINNEDWLEWKPIVVSIWIAMQDALARQDYEMEPRCENTVLRKGD